jgi:hypothetical protein
LPAITINTFGQMHRVTITVLEYDKTQEGEERIFRCGLQNVSVGLKRGAPRWGKDTNRRKSQKMFQLGQGRDVMNRMVGTLHPARQLSRSNMMARGVGQSFHQGAQMPFKLPPASKRCRVYRLPRLRHARGEDRLMLVLRFQAGGLPR